MNGLIEYAATFFLLADSLKDAVNTCVNQLDDLQLGIAIARVYEGDEGPVLRDLLENRVLPTAVTEGNRWLATWAFWILNRRDMAVRALVVSRYQHFSKPIVLPSPNFPPPPQKTLTYIHPIVLPRDPPPTIQHQPPPANL